MIKATYNVKGGELELRRVGEHCSPHLICTLFKVEVQRESVHTISVTKDNELIGVLRFDEAGYGIPVRGDRSLSQEREES